MTGIPTVTNQHMHQTSMHVPTFIVIHLPASFSVGSGLVRQAGDVNVFGSMSDRSSNENAGNILNCLMQS